MKETLKEILKKLNNFRLSSLLISIGALVGLISVIIALSLYQTSGTTLNLENVEVVTNAFANNQISGMLFFLFAIIAIILALVTLARAFKFIFPKTKEIPDHNLVWILVAENVFVLGLLIMIFVLLGTESTRHMAGFVFSIVIGFLSIIYSALLVYPNLKCNYYMPEIVNNK